MNKLLIFTLGTALTVTVLNASAQTYHWKDSAGRTVISDTPPPGSAKEGSRTIGGKTQAINSTSAAQPAEAPKTFAEKEMDFKKRRQESAEKSEKEAKERSAAAEKRDNCERAQKQVALLESGQRIATVDEKGERRIMDSAEQAIEMERTRLIASESCK
ncbi:MAG: hypothetical protein RLZZ298_892 [Pseudomonadota bacterium]|jgi:hypothetical protein